MSDNPDESTHGKPEHEQLIAALLMKPTVTAAAKHIGISEAAAYRWQRDPAFKAAYREARRQTVTHAMTLLERMTGAAVAAIGRHLKADVPSQFQLKAAEIVLSYNLKLEGEDLEARISELVAEHDQVTPLRSRHAS